MEDREQHSSGHGNHRSSPHEIQTTSVADNAIHNQPLPDEFQNFEPVFGAGIYIVQVPKDQVFRIPPRAVLGRQVDNLQPRKSGCCWCSRCFCWCILVIVLVIIVAIIGVIVKIFLTHDDPVVHIEHVLLKKLQPPEFDFRMKVENPNKHQSISYVQDSDVTLSFKQKEIADGRFPIFYQDPKHSTVVNIVLHGSKKELPKEIGTSMNSTRSNIRIPLSLSMEFGMKFEVWALKVKSKRIQVSCSLTVDRLDKDSHILAQDCGTN